MYLVSLSLLAHRHWRADMSMWCIELEIWLVEQRLPPNATATNWTGGNALQYDYICLQYGRMSDLPFDHFQVFD